MTGLNESPSEKEGKFVQLLTSSVHVHEASMKVPPKRKGNPITPYRVEFSARSLNESPSEKEGKWRHRTPKRCRHEPASMKALPKRKGNSTSTRHS